MSLTPDGIRYFAASERRVARPFHYRWLIPTLCGRSETNWRAVRTVSLLGLPAAAFWYGGTGWRGLFVAALATGCAGIWKFAWDHPVLVDAPALTLAVVSAGAAVHHWWWLCVITACLAGMTKETSPLFAALFAWSPLPLIGFLPVCVRAVMRSGPDVLDEENAWILAHPFRASRKYHAGFPPAAWILPWGVCLMGLGHPSWQLAAVLAAAYAQCVVATDTVRLYQWAYPMLAVAASQTVDPRWFLPLIALHVANPFAGSGI